MSTAAVFTDPSDDDLVGELCRRAASSDDAVHDAVHAAVRHLAPLRSVADRQVLVRRALANLTGLGELDDLLADPDVDEILINAGSDVWVDRAGTVVFHGRLSNHTVEHLVERMLAPLGRRVDRTSPIVDARLGDGSRVCAVLHPIAVDGAILSIRKFADAVRPLDDFTDASGIALVREVLEAQCNVVVSGATSSGKSSFLAALLACIPASQRIVVVEDTTELVIASTNSVRLEARPPQVDGPMPIPLADLVRTALRLRPDRIVVGEVRGDEVLALVQAMNTGHDGSLSSCHANSGPDALLRLEGLIVQAAPAWPLEAVRQQLHRSIDVIVHLDRQPDGRRRIDSIVEVGAPSSDASHAPPTNVLAATDTSGALRQCGTLTRRRTR